METRRHRGVIACEHIKIGSDSYEKVKTFKYLGSLLLLLLLLSMLLISRSEDLWKILMFD